MNPSYLNDLQEQQYLAKLHIMSEEEINQNLVKLNCRYTYHMIKEQLATTYNDLEIADAIFKQDEIKLDHIALPSSFIDDVILEIVSREPYDFTHYGLISDRIEEVLECGTKEEIDVMEDAFRVLFKTAKKFQIQSLESMVYRVNDGLDMNSAIITMLDAMMQLGRTEKRYNQRIVHFVDKYLLVFPKASDLTKLSLRYEQAKALIAMHSKKGEQIFVELIKTHYDPTDVVFHYMLAYIDDYEEKALRIYQKYKAILNAQSESYAILMQVLEDM